MINTKKTKGIINFYTERIIDFFFYNIDFKKIAQKKFINNEDIRKILISNIKDYVSPNIDNLKGINDDDCIDEKVYSHIKRNYLNNIENAKENKLLKIILFYHIFTEIREKRDDILGEGKKFNMKDFQKLQSIIDGIGSKSGGFGSYVLSRMINNVNSYYNEKEKIQKNIRKLNEIDKKVWDNPKNSFIMKLYNIIDKLDMFGYRIEISPYFDDKYKRYYLYGEIETKNGNKYHIKGRQKTDYLKVCLNEEENILKLTAIIKEELINHNLLATPTLINNNTIMDEYVEDSIKSIAWFPSFYNELLKDGFILREDVDINDLKEYKPFYNFKSLIENIPKIHTYLNDKLKEFKQGIINCKSCGSFIHKDKAKNELCENCINSDIIKKYFDNTKKFDFFPKEIKDMFIQSGTYKIRKLIKPDDIVKNMINDKVVSDNLYIFGSKIDNAFGIRLSIFDDYDDIEENNNTEVFFFYKNNKEYKGVNLSDFLNIVSKKIYQDRKFYETLKKNNLNNIINIYKSNSSLSWHEPDGDEISIDVKKTDNNSIKIFFYKRKEKIGELTTKDIINIINIIDNK